MKHFPRVMKVDSPEYREYIEACSNEAWKEEVENERETYLENEDYKK